MDIITFNLLKNPHKKSNHLSPPNASFVFTAKTQQDPSNPKPSSETPSPQNPATQVIYLKTRRSSSRTTTIHQERSGFRFPQLGRQQMLFLCGFGYWMQGFGCFPWLALNFHMAHNLQMHPSTLQLVQHSANLPMVTKSLYGVLSDALYISGAQSSLYFHWRSVTIFLPYLLRALPNLMACVLLSDLGASITEVAQDALVAEYGQEKNMTGLQSYAFMAAAAGGILDNLIGGYFLMKTPPRTMCLVFAVLPSAQLAISLRIREESLDLPQLPDDIARPLIWIVASIAMVLVLSGSIFCYQTQCLHLNPVKIGKSRVVGQLVLLSTAVLYDRYWKKAPIRKIRKLVGLVQLVYAFSLLLDLVLVRQINVRLGIPNEVFVLCFSGLAETIVQFKILPFTVLFANICPRGFEGSLASFLASALCLSLIASGFLGAGLAPLIGITAGDYSSLVLGIMAQFLAALLPLGRLHNLPMSEGVVGKERKRGFCRRSQKNRRVGRVVYG
ncbi:folate-biopterin transporter 8 [Pyrus ussuriensis x Pyrus communis]|uniref:Folate-biopterin transporter 8 n=1 Tax=Pyrus ussuriensis x Pyrus communis TaxID=2448454 RepID=A0A5N5FQP7_9ROSA|nr:folate-biopterin transporter 8 [Pyrus ussuriensis x Pyrus communis]